MEITPDMIDAAAKYLRNTQQGGKRLTPWEETPRATKRKWLALAEGALSAALSKGTRRETLHHHRPADLHRVVRVVTQPDDIARVVDGLAQSNGARSWTRKLWPMAACWSQPIQCRTN